MAADASTTTLSGSALISGGLGDIGLAIARTLARAGADIAVCDLADSAQAAPLLHDIAAMGRRARYDRIDVGDERAVEAWVEACARDLGAPTIGIPNAAVVSSASCMAITAAEWRRQIRVALDGAFFVAQATARRMRDAGIPGRIVTIGSWAAERPHPHIPAYCAAKAGLRMAMRCLALELAPAGILVNEVAPGYVDAGLSGRTLQVGMRARAAAISRVPTGKLIASEEVAQAVAWLCGPHAAHCTGSVLTLDGGLSLLAGGA